MAQCICGWPGQECLVHKWASPWQRKQNHLMKWGLEVRLHLRIQADGFVALDVEVQPGWEWLMLRNSSAWVKHITIGYLYDPDELNLLRRRWNGKHTHLTFNYVGTGGAAYLGPDCELMKCRTFRRLKRRAYYRYEFEPHISF